MRVDVCLVELQRAAQPQQRGDDLDLCADSQQAAHEVFVHDVLPTPRGVLETPELPAQENQNTTHPQLELV